MTDYYVKVGGNDASDGLSDANAWSTFEPWNNKMAAGTINPGDRLLLNRGDTWIANITSATTKKRTTLRMQGSSGSSGNPIVVDAYGTGPLPKLDGNGLNTPLVWNWTGSTIADYITIRNLGLTNNISSLIVGSANGSDYWTVEYCHIHDCGTVGNPVFGVQLGDDNGVSSVGSTGHIVRYNHIHDVYGEAIYIGSSHNNTEPDETNNVEIYGNEIISCGEGIDLKRFTHTIKIYDNILVDCGYYGGRSITIGGHDIEIYDNIIKKGRSSTLSGIQCGVYWSQDDNTNGGYNVLITRNLFEGFDNTVSDGAVHCDGKNNKVINNTFANNDRAIRLDYRSGTDQVTHTEHILENNAFYNNTYDVYSDITDTTKFSSDYNSYDSANWRWGGADRDFTYIQGTIGEDANSLEGAQGFKDTVHFHLAAGSNLINAGTDTNVDPADYIGSAPDIGWFEKDLASWRDEVRYDDADIAALWMFENASNLGEDSSANSNDLTNNNTVTQNTTTFKRGSASAEFTEASSQSMSIADASQTGLDLGTSWTIAFWVRPDTTVGVEFTRLITKFNPTGNQRSFQLNINSTAGDLRFTHSTDGSATTNFDTANGVVSGDTWTHVTLICADGVLTWYIDGLPHYDLGNNPDQLTGPLFDSTADFYISDRDGEGLYFFDGLLDEIAFFNRALSWREVMDVYQYGIATIIYIYVNDTLFLLDNNTTANNMIVVDSLSLDNFNVVNTVSIISDSISLSDSITNNNILFVSDNFIISNLTNIVSNVLLTDSISIQDLITIYLIKNISDSLVLTDQITNSVVLLVDDNVNISETLTNRTTLLVQDSFVINDLVSLFVNIMVSDFILISDLFTISIIVGILDTLNLSEILINNAAIFVADDINIVDEVILYVDTNVLDNLGLSENISLSQTINISDLVSLVESTSIQNNISVIDLLNLYDGLSIEIDQKLGYIRFKFRKSQIVDS